MPSYRLGPPPLTTRAANGWTADDARREAATWGLGCGVALA